MKELLAQMLRSANAGTDRVNLLREVLQARILEGLQRAGAMRPLAFHGGTALRFLYGLPRYSEDLDFALERRDAGYDLRRDLREVERSLSAEGYTVELKLDQSSTVHSSLVRFPGLLYELGLSPHANQVLSIKVEVDTDPPAGAGLDTTVVRRLRPLNLQHHDRPSLLAGKLHAILQRPYVKGRDLYDMVWYLADPTWPPPNLELLNNALAQTGWPGGSLSPEGWHRAVADRLAGVSMRTARNDVAPFLEAGADPDVLTRENLVQLLGGR